MKKYIILGNYGATNIGDEAILGSIIDELHEEEPNAQITVMSYNSSRTRKMHEVTSVSLFPFGIRSLFKGIFKGELLRTVRALKQADTIIFGGGGLFTDDKLRAVFLWFWQIFWARLFCENVIFYKQTVGKLSTKTGRYLTKMAFGYADEVSVRDKESKNLLNFLGIENVRLSRDPVMDWKYIRRYVRRFYKSAALKDDSGQKKNRYMTLCIREWHMIKPGFLEYVARAVADYAKEHKLTVYFTPFQIFDEDDRRVYKELKEIIEKDKALSFHLKLYRFDYNIPFKQGLKDLLDLYLGAEKVVAMRLHSIIIGYLCRRNVTAIPYSNKVQSFINSVGIEGVSPLNVDKLSNLLS